MKRLIPLLFLFAAPAHADLMHSITTSTQLNVNAAATQAERIGSSFSISGNNVDTTDGTTANTVSAGAISSGVYGPGTISAVQDDPGEAFSFTTSFTQGDALVTSAPSVGAVSAYSDQLSTAAGTVADLDGSVTSQHTTDLTAGGAGTSATSQFVTEIQIN